MSASNVSPRPQRLVLAVVADRLAIEPDDDPIDRLRARQRGRAQRRGHLRRQLLRRVRTLLDRLDHAVAHAELLVRVRGVAQPHGLPARDEAGLPRRREELRRERRVVGDQRGQQRAGADRLAGARRDAGDGPGVRRPDDRRTPRVVLGALLFERRAQPGDVGAIGVRLQPAVGDAGRRGPRARARGWCAVARNRRRRPAARGGRPAAPARASARRSRCARARRSARRSSRRSAAAPG